jgi:hypothetical protein
LNIAPDTNVTGLSISGSTGTTTSASGTITTTDANAIAVTNLRTLHDADLCLSDNTGDADNCVNLTTQNRHAHDVGRRADWLAPAQPIWSAVAMAAPPTTAPSLRASAARVIDAQSKTGGTLAFGGGHYRERHEYRNFSEQQRKHHGQLHRQHHLEWHGDHLHRHFERYGEFDQHGEHYRRDHCTFGYGVNITSTNIDSGGMVFTSISCNGATKASF